MTLAEIAAITGSSVSGSPDINIDSVNGIEEARSGQLSFVANQKYAKFIPSTSASAIIVGQDTPQIRDDIAYLVSLDPYQTFVQALRLFAPKSPAPQPGVHPTAVISAGVTIGTGVSIGPHAVIESGCEIGDDSVIMAGVYLGQNVRIGHHTTLHPNVVVYYGCQLGNKVVLQAGAVIGADGFGYIRNSSSEWENIPQTGIVVLEDNVEIGSNTTVDRATLGETRICQGVKLDNQIHIAHNVVLGRNTVIAAQSGIAGSARIGRGNMIAGQVGIVGHIETVDDVIIEPQSGVSKSLRKPGRYFGHPAKEHVVALRQEAAIRQLPELLQEIKELRLRLEHLEPQS